jgi:hypothetical protein
MTSFIAKFPMAEISWIHRIQSNWPRSLIHQRQERLSNLFGCLIASCEKKSPFSIRIFFYFASPSHQSSKWKTRWKYHQQLFRYSPQSMNDYKRHVYVFGRCLSRKKTNLLMAVRCFLVSPFYLKMRLGSFCQTWHNSIMDVWVHMTLIFFNSDDSEKGRFLVCKCQTGGI